MLTEDIKELDGQVIKIRGYMWPSFKQKGITAFVLLLNTQCKYGSAKDPVNMAGFVAAGLLRGDHPQIDVSTLLEKAEQYALLDVRTPKEYDSGHIPGAASIPVDDLRSRLDELPRDADIVVYCQVGMRGYLATRILMQAGFQVANLAGGYKTYTMFQPSREPAAV